MVYYMTETNLWPLNQRCGSALVIKEVQLHCPTILAPSAPRWCAAPPLLACGLGIHDNASLPRPLVPRDGKFPFNLHRKVAVTRRFAVAVLLMSLCPA
jgi:hypothetical protein